MSPDQERTHDELRAKLRALAPALREADLRVPAEVLAVNPADTD
jgi:hypothetical protein